MKRIKILALLLMLFFSVKGQITITGEDLPQAGQTFLVGNDTTPVINLGTASSTSQIWDFSNLVNHYPKVADYDATSNTPYSAAFPFSNIDTYGPAYMYSSFHGGAPVDSAEWGYMFWKSDSTGFWITGFREETGEYAGINVYYSPYELLIEAPCTYGSSTNNSSRWELPLNKNAFDQDTFYITNIQKTLSVDAWGEIITPYDSFSQVIRLHEYLVKNDSVRMEMSLFDTTFLLITDTLNNYYFWTKNLGYPVAIVHADKNNMIKDVEYMTDSAFIVSVTPPVSECPFTIYPNPVEESFRIEFNGNIGNVNVFIYDLNGKLVLKHEEVYGGELLSVNNLQQGKYIIRVETKEKRSFLDSFLKLK